jgi:hypothetical protein
MDQGLREKEKGKRRSQGLVGVFQSPSLLNQFLSQLFNMPGTLDPEKTLTRLFGSVSRTRILHPVRIFSLLTKSSLW